MYLCVDVHYTDNRACAAGVVFDDFESAGIIREYVRTFGQVDAYLPGHFYKRELPVILELLREIEYDLEIIVIDGYVWLSPDLRPGIGAHLYNSLQEKSAVIGVAKSVFKDASSACRVYRGRSRKPLFVTAAGMENTRAACLIEHMHGRYRLPTLVKYVDRLSRQGN